MLALANKHFLDKSAILWIPIKKATQNPFGYLLIDLDPKTLRYKLRTNIIPGQLMSVFLPETVAGTK